MVGLIHWEVCNSIFNMTDDNNNFELQTDTFDVFSFAELIDELEEMPSFAEITPQDLQHQIRGPRFSKACERLRLEESSTDGYPIVVMGYARSPFRNFESHLGILVGLIEDDIQFFLKHYISCFITYEISIGTIQLKIFQMIFTQKAILKGLYKLNKMT